MKTVYFNDHLSTKPVMSSHLKSCQEQEKVTQVRDKTWCQLRIFLSMSEALGSSPSNSKNTSIT